MLDLYPAESKAAALDTSISSSSAPSPCSVHLKLPKLSVPTFRGDPMKWSVFWDNFQAAIHDNPHVDDRQKLAYLREAIQDLEVEPMLKRSTTTHKQYKQLVEFLKETYSMALVNAPAIKQGTHEELAAWSHTVSAV